MNSDSTPPPVEVTPGEPKLSYPLDTRSQAAMCDNLQRVLNDITSGQLKTSDSIRQAIGAVIGTDSGVDVPPQAEQILVQIRQHLTR
jgi:hypothetical protein